MKVNIATFERTARIWVGMTILATPLLELGTSPYHLLGLIPLVSGLVGYCPLYGLVKALRIPKSNTFPAGGTGASRA
jgi:hypothetical protein